MEAEEEDEEECQSVEEGTGEASEMTWLSSLREVFHHVAILRPRAAYSEGKSKDI